MEKLPESLQYFLVFIMALDNLATIVASSIAIYLFVCKRDKIASVFKVLINFSSQVSLNEIRLNLERLNILTANDSDQNEEVVNIFGEILGQIRGNQTLTKQFSTVIPKLEKIAGNRISLKEPDKRSLVSEIRERLRHIDLEYYGDIIGDRK